MMLYHTALVSKLFNISEGSAPIEDYSMDYGALTLPKGFSGDCHVRIKGLTSLQWEGMLSIEPLSKGLLSSECSSCYRTGLPKG